MTVRGNNLLGPDDVKEMARLQRRAVRSLVSPGWSGSEISRALQSDVSDVYERKSAACAYEQERVRRIVSELLPSDCGEWYLVTAGNPRQRIEIGQLSTFDLSPLRRQFRSACERLAAMGYSPIGLAVIEVHVCAPLNGERFWEPHFHALICGVPPDDLKAAFRVRPVAQSTFRNRLTKVQPVTDFPGILGYVLKFKPEDTHEYLDVDGSSNWAPNDLRGSELDDWVAWMAGHGAAQLLTGTGMHMHSVSRALSRELATSHRTNPQLLSRGAF